MIQVRVRPGVEDNIRGFFPWVYKKDIIGYSKKPQKGEIVVVRDYAGRFLGYGYINLDSNISVRMLSFEKEEPVSKELIRKRIKKALEYRKKLNLQSNAYRLVHSEGDLLPGLVVDVYGDYAVVELNTYGMSRLKEWVFEALVDLLKPEGIYQKVGEYASSSEGIEEREGIVYGRVPEEVVITEGDLKYKVQISGGQKTGFFLDQRRERGFIRELVKEKSSCLDLFCYTGGFALNMKKAGAEKVVAVELSEKALQTARLNAELNGLSGIDWVEANAFDYLRKLQSEGKKFDLIVIDPPTFAKSSSSIQNAMRGYKELLVRTLHIVKPEGYIAFYSCSFHITREHLLRALSEAAKDLRRQVRIIRESSQDLDHPWLLQAPSTLYLKGIYAEVV